jgi:hypothetical protein
LVIPTIVIGTVVGVCFALGASPPEGLLSRPRAAPWDQLTATKVLNERAAPVGVTNSGPAIDDLVGPSDRKDLTGPSQNGHVG